MTYFVRPFGLFLFLIICLLSHQVVAAEIKVAVASNFLIPLKYIVKVYQQETGEKVIISTGSTGKLYAQIVNGAPFDVFLAANRREPERLEKENYTVHGSRFTYAQGKLALWDPKGLHQQSSVEEVLKAVDYKRLSLANPLTAPYGAAAIAVLQQLKLDKTDKVKFLRGENVSQAFQYVASGAADLGFVALSQLLARSDHQQGSYWVVDEKMHSPILQQAVLMKNTQQKLPAQLFLNYLKSSRGQAMIKNFGYGIR